MTVTFEEFSSAHDFFDYRVSKENESVCVRFGDKVMPGPKRGKVVR